MGYETPVEMPSMGIYNTDLMKMYIAGVKDQYEKGQEEMKDFMKLYGDFYSPIPGATEAYNRITIGGANDMINQMLTNGIDPYKSPEARAAISKYIASVPTGVIKQLEQQKEDYSKYQDAVRDAIARGTYNAPMEDYYIQKEGLKNFQATSINPDGTIKVNDWTRLAPAKFSTLESITSPFFKDLEKIDFVGNDPKHPGYSIYKVADDVLANALRGGVDAVRNNPNGDFYIYQAEKKLNNAGITRETNPENYDQLVAEQLAQDVKQANAQAWQTKSDWDKYGEQMRDFNHAERMENIRHQHQMQANGYKWNPKTKSYVKVGNDGDHDVIDGGLSITNRLINAGNGIVVQKAQTGNIKKGYKRLVINHIKTSEGHRSDAKAFFLKNMLQDLNGPTFTSLAVGVKSVDGRFNYRPSRDGRRLSTYTQLGNNLAMGEIGFKNGSKFKFQNNSTTTNKYTQKDGGEGKFTYNADDYKSIVRHLNSLYDPANPERIQIQHNGGAFSTLLNDGYYHENAPVTVIVWNRDGSQIEEKFDMPYDFAVPISPYIGNDPQRTAEGVLSDQIGTITAGGRPNSNNKTIGLTGQSGTKK